MKKIFFLFSLVFCLSCNPTNLSCEEIWEVEQKGSFHPSQKKEFLEINSKGDLMAGDYFKLSQDGLSGNFLATLEFEEFERGENGNGLYLILRTQNTITGSSAGIIFTDASDSSVGLQAGSFMIEENSDSMLKDILSVTDFLEVNETSGSLSIFKNGSKLTFSANFLGVNLLQETIDFFQDSQTIEIIFGAHSENIEGNSLIHLKEFFLSTVAVGGEESDLQADDFDCYSLKF